MMTIHPAIPTIPRSSETRNKRRSVSDLMKPLEIRAAHSTSLVSNYGARFRTLGQSYALPRYLFLGPQAGADPIRLGIFATIHGDEAEGAHALIQFLSLLDKSPDLARGYCLFIYPVCNPTGYEDNTRCSRRGRDLNREFWNNSSEPEIALLETELCTHAFDGIISLHSDDTSRGLYGFASGATLTRHLLDPALSAAAQVLPRNQDSIIDGFNADNGIIRRGYQGVLRAPPKIRPRPFEIILETPQIAPQYLQEQALVVALLTILREYRAFISYAANL